MKERDPVSIFLIALAIMIVMDVFPIAMLLHPRWLSEDFWLQTLLVFSIVSMIAVFWLTKDLTKSPFANFSIGFVIFCIQGFLAFLCLVGLSFHPHH